MFVLVKLSFEFEHKLNNALMNKKVVSKESHLTIENLMSKV